MTLVHARTKAGQRNCCGQSVTVDARGDSPSPQPAPPMARPLYGVTDLLADNRRSVGLIVL